MGLYRGKPLIAVKNVPFRLFWTLFHTSPNPCLPFGQTCTYPCVYRVYSEPGMSMVRACTGGCTPTRVYRRAYTGVYHTQGIQEGGAYTHQGASHTGRIREVYAQNSSKQGEVRGFMLKTPSKQGELTGFMLKTFRNREN